MTSSIPKPSEPIAGPGGTITRPWRNYLSQLGGARSLEEIWAALREIRQQLADAGAGSFLTRDTALLGVNSVQTLGQLSDGQVRIQLRGDTPAPAARTFYGANADGALGFWSNAEGVDVGTGLAKTLDYGPYDFKGELSNESDLPPVVVVGDAYLIAGYLWAGIDEGRPGDPAWDNLGLASPTTVLSLEEIPDSGGGALFAITRDQFGRVSGTSEATTDDLPEGVDSLYFTIDRARQSVVDDFIDPGVSNKAPSQRAVADAIAGGGGGGGGVNRRTVTNINHASTGPVSIDAALGDYFVVTMSASGDLEVVNPPAQNIGASISIEIVQDATGGRTLGLPSSFKALAGSDAQIQSAANARTEMVISTNDQGVRWKYVMQGIAA